MRDISDIKERELLQNELLRKNQLALELAWAKAKAAQEYTEKMLVREQELRQQLEETKNLAEHDPLTGLWNKGAYQTLETLHSSTRNVAVLIVDVDDFKNVNDNHGHSIGDEVLKFVGKTLREAFRASDMVARIGGDEFAIMLTNITNEQRELIERKINGIFAKLQAGSPGLPLVTLSVGIAFSDAHELKAAKKIGQMADKAMYQAKGDGKNRYAFYN